MMTTKVGSIASRGRTGAKFVEAYLTSGERVELSHPMWDHATTVYPPGQRLVFVERRGRLFRFVHWVGTPEEASDALAQGTLTQDELPPEARAMPELDKFLVRIEALSSSQWSEAVMAFIRLQMSDEASHHAAWQSALDLAGNAVRSGDAALGQQVRTAQLGAQAAVEEKIPVGGGQDPKYEAFRRAAGDMTLAAAMSVVLHGRLPESTENLLYEPFREFLEGATPPS